MCENLQKPEPHSWKQVLRSWSHVHEELRSGSWVMLWRFRSSGCRLGYRH